MLPVGTGSTYLSDLTALTVKYVYTLLYNEYRMLTFFFRELPSKDGIIEPALLDPYLQTRGHYDTLPFLPCVFVPYLTPNIV